MSRRRQEEPREYEVVIERLSHEGRGVGHLNGKTVFVDGALPGEHVLARVVRRHRRFDEAITLTVEAAPAASRVAPRCVHAARCGGCSLQHLDPSAQLAHKQAVLLELLRHQAHIEPTELLAAVAGPAWAYRRRARISVRLLPKKDGVVIGFREKASHFVTDIDHCAVLVPSVGERIPALRTLIDGLSIKGDIPQLEIAADDTQTLVLIRHLVAPTEADLERMRIFEAETGLHLYLQAGSPADSQPVSAPVDLQYRLDGLAYHFLPGDFVQVNGAINPLLVARALGLLAPEADEDVLDLFCGLGNFTLPIARRAASVVGLEGELGLVQRAQANAGINKLANVRFEAADLFTEAGVARAATKSFPQHAGRYRSRRDYLPRNTILLQQT